MFDTKPITQKIKAYRQQKNIKQAELAKHIGVSSPTVSRWEHENDNFNPTLSQLVGMADLFGVSLIELLTIDSETTLIVEEKPEEGVKPAKKTSKAKAAEGSSSEEKKPAKRTIKSKAAATAAKVAKTKKADTQTKPERKTPVKKATKATKEQAAKTSTKK